MKASAKPAAEACAGVRVCTASGRPSRLIAVSGADGSRGARDGETRGRALAPGWSECRGAGAVTQQWA